MVKMLQNLFAAGVVDLSSCFDFKMSPNATSAEVALFLRDDLKDLRSFLLKRFLFFIDIKVKKRNKSTTPAGK